MPPAKRNDLLPRRRSCSACVKSKRRCSLHRPICSRCSKKNIHCRYIGAETSQADSNQDPSQSLIPNPKTPSRGPEFWAGLPALATSTALTSTWEDNELNAEVISILEGNMDSQSNVGRMISPIIAQGLSESQTPTAQNPTPAPLYGSISMRKPVGFGYLSHLIATRLQYTIDAIKKAPMSMVLENQTPWCHSLLYRAGMPRPMQDAQAICGLYLHKNSINGATIMRTIDSRVGDLSHQPIPNGRLEVLARTQALILYQVIRLFDGDVSLVTTVHDTVPILAASAAALGQHLTDASDDVDEITKSTPYPNGVSQLSSAEPGLALETPLDTLESHSALDSDLTVWDALPSPYTARLSLYHDWLFKESARRTYLIAFMFIQIYRMLVLHIPLRKDTQKFCQSFTISSYLWDAPDFVSFELALRSSRYHIFRGNNVSDILPCLRGDDVDVYSKMLMTIVLGEEETKALLTERGGFL